MLKRLAPLSAALTILLILLLLAGAGKAENTRKAVKERAGEIDVSLPVTMSKCAPCHDSLDRVEYETIKIPHYLHLKKGIRCRACHNTDLPHDKGTLNKPTMDACFNCHGLNHGPQGQMAPTECKVCHPDNFDLTPKDHTREWKNLKHKDADARLKRQCVQCHQGERNTCIICHKDDENLPITLRINTKSTVTPANNKQYKVNPDGEVNISKCNPCHDNWDRVEYEKIRFYHSIHFARGVRCGFCHQSFPHRRGYIVKPKMQQCFTCHGTEHGTIKGRLAPSGCGVCHPSEMNLIPDFHTVAFRGGEHRKLAKKDRGLCRMCHEQKFCDDCHQLNEDQIPHPPGWKSIHGSVADSTAATGPDGSFICFRCHKPEGPKYSYQSAPSCSKCHKAVVFPHQQPWAPVHGKTAISVGKDVCYTCHKDQTFCNGCHNGITMPHDKKTWYGGHRQFLQNNSIDKCLGCHQVSQCLQCHATHKVHNQHEIYDFSGLKR